ncbi:hypothetical protein ACXDF8_25755 [Mycolicibacterium sp. CBM1]
MRILQKITHMTFGCVAGLAIVLVGAGAAQADPPGPSGPPWAPWLPVVWNADLSGWGVWWNGGFIQL